MTQADQAIQRVAALSSSVPAVVVPMTGGRTRPTGLSERDLGLPLLESPPSVLVMPPQAPGDSRRAGNHDR